MKKKEAVGLFSIIVFVVLCLCKILCFLLTFIYTLVPEMFDQKTYIYFLICISKFHVQSRQKSPEIIKAMLGQLYIEE